MSRGLLSPCLIVLGALLLLALERRFPYEPRQRLFRAGFWTDLLGYGLVQSYLLGLCISRLIVWIDGASGLSRLRLVSAWPVPAQLAFFLVTHDLYIYWFHRLQHRSSWLWRTHEAHHSGDDVDWLSGTRSHSLEILINQSIEFAPILLLGAAPELAILKATVDALYGMFIHSNLDVRLGPLGYLLNGPALHRWHHARELAPPGKNFATKLAIWDYLFGTAYLPGSKPRSYGLEERGYPRAGAWAWLEQHAYALFPGSARRFVRR
jgi:sterol desaturase/sphingolipid hydroxylase (fatty acid hydroxylase superfamily)